MCAFIKDKVHPHITSAVVNVEDQQFVPGREIVLGQITGENFEEFFAAFKEKKTNRVAKTESQRVMKYAWAVFCSPYAGKSDESFVLKYKATLEMEDGLASGNPRLAEWQKRLPPGP